MGQTQQFDIGFNFPSVIDTIVTFTVRTLKIDNPGGNWLYQPDTQQYVGPFTLSAYIALKGDNNRVTVKVQAPSGRSSYQSGTYATITAMEDAVASSPGFGIPDNTAPLGFQQHAFTVTNADITSAIGFSALTCAVDNPGGRWINVHGLRTIPPYWTGAIVVLPLAVTLASLVVSTAAPPPQVNTQRGNPAVCTYFDGALPAQAGSSIDPALISVPSSTPLASQSGTGPNPGGVLSFTVTTPGVVSNGVVYNITHIEAWVLLAPGNNTVVSVPASWLLTYNASPLASGALGTGSLVSPGVAPSQIEVNFTSPIQITGATGAQFSFGVFKQDGNNLGLNEIVVQFYVWGYAAP